MLSNIWAFLQDEANRTLLTWLGGGVVVVAGGVWAVIKYLGDRKSAYPKGSASPSVSADRGGVAAGHDIRDSRIDTNRDKR